MNRSLKRRTATVPRVVAPILGATVAQAEELLRAALAPSK